MKCCILLNIPKQKQFPLQKNFYKGNFFTMLFIFYKNQTIPCAIIASATFIKPAILAPETRL